MALPDNSIPRVFINTGIEYNKIVEYVKREQEKDNRIVIIKPTKNIKTMLEEDGYPFKSKDHSQKVDIYQRLGMCKTSQTYLDRTDGYQCPKILRYQFTNENKLRISANCCKRLKKEPAYKWSKENGKSILMTGMRSGEGGARTNKGCLTVDSNKKLRFHPLMPMTEEWVDWFIKEYSIELCELYYPPYNFTRTGCKGCPYALDLKQTLETLDRLLPNERKQCELIWEPVYNEYRRIGYRLK